MAHKGEEEAIEAALVLLGEDRLDPLALARALRASLAPDLARRAAERRELRRRAADKLARASELRLTPLGLAQATDRRVAAWRAGRLRSVAGLVVDATAGIGGDAMALASHGLEVLAFERDSEPAACLAFNLELVAPARAWVARGDAEALPVTNFAGLVLDPNRRVEGARTVDPRRYSPNWSVVCALLERAQTLACVKLAPAFDPSTFDDVDLPSLPRRWSWVSLAGELKELSFWRGPILAGDAPREAIAIARSGAVIERAGSPSRPPPQRDPAGVSWIAEVDPALVRAGLVGALAEELGLTALTPDGGYVGGAERPDSPWIKAFRVLDHAPLDAKRVRSMLRRHDIGPLTVKKRGVSASAEELARRWKAKGTLPGTLLAARHAEGQHVWLVER